MTVDELRQMALAAKAHNERLGVSTRTMGVMPDDLLALLDRIANYDLRVSGLLVANNLEVERRRAAEAKIDHLTKCCAHLVNALAQERENCANAARIEVLEVMNANYALADDVFKVIMGQALTTEI